MTIEELYDMTVLLEHLKSGKKSCADVNRVYGYLNKPKGLFTKKQKIRLIQEYWNTLADKTIKEYLIGKQSGQFSGNTNNE